MTEFRIHIGAHKTATTHFQDCLYRAIERIQLQGKDYVPRIDCRQKKIVEQIHEASAQAALSDANSASLATILQNNGYNAKTILMSEENMMGSSMNLIANMYPKVVGRLDHFIKLRGIANINFFLSIRSYEHVLPSAYSQALRDGASIPPFSSIRDYWLSEKPSWYKLIQVIINLCGASQLTIWSFENYIRSPKEILENFSGSNFDDINLSAIKTNTRMGTDTIRKIELLDRSLNFAERRIRIKDIVTNSISNDYDPLTKSEKRLLNERYMDDCEKISKLGIKVLF